MNEMTVPIIIAIVVLGLGSMAFIALITKWSLEFLIKIFKEL